jgi:hypothetical protein
MIGFSSLHDMIQMPDKMSRSSVFEIGTRRLMTKERRQSRVLYFLRSRRFILPRAMPDKSHTKVCRRQYQSHATCLDLEPYEVAVVISEYNVGSGVRRHDSQARVRKIPALFAQKESEDRAAAQSRHLCQQRRRAEARARRSIFQAGVICFLSPLCGEILFPSRPQPFAERRRFARLCAARGGEGADGLRPPY